MENQAREITDLHGNKFKVKDYKLTFEVPIKDGNKSSYTRDLISGIPFCLVNHQDIYKAYFYNQPMKLYVYYKLDRFGYDESKDIRKAYLYGKRR